VSAPEALVFEDSPIGIAAAKRCGVPVAFVREFAWRDTCAEADLCFDTLEDALPWVQERIR
jgi:beta-phosphoglucomutase-like phosphatase (HAD superfamily)